MRYYTCLLEWQKFKPPPPNADKDVEQQQVLLTADRNAKRQTAWQFLTKLNILLPYDPEIAFWYLLKKELKKCPRKNLHVDFCGSFIDNP